MEKQTYISPEVEVIEIAIEKGFATSGEGGPGKSPIDYWE